MAGNSRRKGAGKRGANTAAGSGGRIRKGLAGRGPTPKAIDRPYHPAYRKRGPNDSPITTSKVKSRRSSAAPKAKGADWVVGRNPVFEALQANLPIKNIFIAAGVERDSRLRDILKYTAENGIPMQQVARNELDHMTGGLAHQGVALQLPAYEYADFGEMLASGDLIVVLANVTDPRNLGAIIRSAAAFQASGVVIPERRSASMTAAAWKTSAGTAAKLPVAQVTNINQTLRALQQAGYLVVGLAGEGETDISGIPGVDGPVALVAGAEDEGLPVLVRKNCDILASIPIQVESLNVSVATAIALYEISRCRGL